MKKTLFLLCLIPAFMLEGGKKVVRNKTSKRHLQSLLIKAIHGNDNEKLLQLMEKRVDPNTKDENGKTALIIALEKDNNIAAQALLKAGATTDQCSDQEKQKIELVKEGKSLFTYSYAFAYLQAASAI